MMRMLAPRSATWLLERFLQPTHREVILGDLIEEYAIRYRASPKLVVAWYWEQVCCSITPLLWLRLRRERWASTVGTALAAYLAAGAIESVAVQALSALLGPNTTAHSLIGMIVGLATLMLFGCLAAWFRPLAAKVLAMLVVVVVGILLLAVPSSAPLWYGLGFLLFGPLAALLGGTFRFTRPRRNP